jgi:hypothetical protein
VTGLVLSFVCQDVVLVHLTQRLKVSAGASQVLSRMHKQLVCKRVWQMNAC